MSGDRVYLAGPVNFAADGGHGWRNMAEQEHPAFDWSNPLDEFDVPSTDANLVYTDEVIDNEDLVSSGAIVRSDKRKVRESDAVLVGWKDVPATGTPMEVLYAWQWGIPVVVWYEGERLSPWMYHHATGVYDAFDDSIEALDDIEVPGDSGPGQTTCETCDEANLANAVHGILQLASCETNDIESVDEAVRLVRQRITEVR